MSTIPEEESQGLRISMQDELRTKSVRPLPCHLDEDLVNLRKAMSIKAVATPVSRSTLPREPTPRATVQWRAFSWLGFSCSGLCSAPSGAPGDDERRLVRIDSQRSSMHREEGLPQYGLTLISRIKDQGSGTLSEKQQQDLEALENVLAKIHEQEEFEQDAYEKIMEWAMGDEETQQWLMGTFGGQSPSVGAHNFRKAAQAVRAGQRMHRMMRMSKMNSKEAVEKSDEKLDEHVKLAFDASLQVDLVELGSWKDFDIFRVERNANGLPLLPVAYTSLQRRGLIERFHLPERELEMFLKAVEDRYISANPYHNSLHAADVTQTAYVLLAHMPFSELEIFAALMAAVCHDVGHPGVTNDFRIKEEDEDAITYSDKSINEHMHCALTYRILRREDCNFLAGLSADQRSTLRKLVVNIILSTDMAIHFSQLNKFKSLTDTKGRDTSKWDDVPLAMEILVHASDISGTSKPRHLALQWTDRILEEFFLQGDRERELNRDISPLCDRKTVSKANAQVGFISFIVKPTFEAIHRINGVPDAKQALENLESFHEFWKVQLESEDRRQKTPRTPRTPRSSKKEDDKASEEHQ